MNFNFFLLIWFLYFILYIRHGFPKKPFKLRYIDWSSLQGEPGFISHNCIIKKETLCIGSYGVKNIDAVMKTSYIDKKKWFFYWSLIICCIRWVLIMNIPTLQASSLLVCLSPSLHNVFPFVIFYFLFVSLFELLVFVSSTECSPSWTWRSYYAIKLWLLIQKEDKKRKLQFLISFLSNSWRERE